MNYLFDTYRDRPGRDRMLVGFTTTYMHSVPITTNGVSSNLDQGEVIKFVSDLRQVVGFFRVLWFPPPIKLTATIYI